MTTASKPTSSSPNSKPKLTPHAHPAFNPTSSNVEPDESELFPPTGAYLQAQPTYPNERGEMTWPPLEDDPQRNLAAWPPVLSYAAAIPPTPYGTSCGGLPQSPVPTAAIQNRSSYDPYVGLPSGSGLFGNPNYPLAEFQIRSISTNNYLNPTSIIWGRSPIPTPEYVRELEQQNIILWSTQKQLSKVLLDDEAKKWLKLLQISLMTVLKLNPVQQLTIKNSHASFTEEDVFREIDHHKSGGATSASAKEYVQSIERQNRLLWETQSLVNSIFTNPDSERWMQKSQAAITTILNLNRIEKLVMKGKDSFGSQPTTIDEEPTSPPSDPHSNNTADHDAESNSHHVVKPVARRAASTATTTAAATPMTSQTVPPSGKRMSIIEAQQAVDEDNKRMNASDDMKQYENRALAGPTDIEMATRMVTDANRSANKNQSGAGIGSSAAGASSLNRAVALNAITATHKQTRPLTHQQPTPDPTKSPIARSQTHQRTHSSSKGFHLSGVDATSTDQVHIHLNGHNQSPPPSTPSSRPTVNPLSVSSNSSNANDPNNVDLISVFRQARDSAARSRRPASTSPITPQQQYSTPSPTNYSQQGHAPIHNNAEQQMMMVRE